MPKDRIGKQGQQCQPFLESGRSVLNARGRRNGRGAEPHAYEALQRAPVRLCGGSVDMARMGTNGWFGWWWPVLFQFP